MELWIYGRSPTIYRGGSAMRSENQFNPCNLLIIFCQRDSTDETVAMRSAILFVRSAWFVFKKKISNILCSYANLAMSFQKAIPLFLVVWTQIAQIARILFVRFIDLREVLYPRITRRNSLIRVITLIKTFAAFALSREVMSPRITGITRIFIRVISVQKRNLFEIPRFAWVISPRISRITRKISIIRVITLIK